MTATSDAFKDIIPPCSTLPFPGPLLTMFGGRKAKFGHQLKVDALKFHYSRV